jgi:hypothetical protein
MQWSGWLAVAAVVLGVAGPAAAADRCAQLSAELATLGRSAGSAKAERYRVSAERQREALRQAERQARRAGCGSLLAAEGCAALQSTIAKMQSNLASLEAVAGTGRGGSKARRSEIRAQMAAAGCQERKPVRVARKPAEERKPEPPKAPVETAALAGTIAPDDPVAPAETAPPAFDRALLDRFAADATYRTICVRTCDGYFFPISWSTKRDGFEADAAMCRKTCPGAATEIYVHAPGTGSDTAQSLAGTSYRDLPTAYHYRTLHPAGCSCEAGPAMSTPTEAAAAPTVEDWQIPDADASTVPTGEPEATGATDPEVRTDLRLTLPPTDG